MISETLLLPDESSRNREMLCIGVAAVVHALMLLWNPAVLKSDAKAVHDFVTVDVVDQPSPGGEEPAAETKKSLMDTLKDMIIKPKEDEIAHVAPEPATTRVAAPMQPALQERNMPRPIATAFQPQSQSEDLATSGPKAIDLNNRNIMPVPTNQPTLTTKAFGGIRSKDLPFQVGTDAGITGGGAASIPIAIGNNSAKEALAYTGPSLKDGGHAPVALTNHGFNAHTGDVATLRAGSTANIPLSGTGGSGNAPTGAPSGSVLQNREGSGGSGSLFNRAFGGAGHGGSVGSGSEGHIPSAAQQLDQQMAGADKAGSSGRTTKKAFDIVGPLNNRTIVKKIIPQYPAWAEEQGIIGSVRLYFTVTPEGAVRADIRVTKTTGYPALDQLGIDALKQWQFAPKPSSDEGQGEWGIITFNFSLSS